MAVVTSLFYAAATFLLGVIALASIPGTSDPFLQLGVISYFVMWLAPLGFALAALAKQADRTWPATNAGPWTGVRILNAVLVAAITVLVALMGAAAFLGIQDTFG